MSDLFLATGYSGTVAGGNELYVATSDDGVTFTAANGNSPSLTLPWRIGDSHIVKIGGHWWACYKEDAPAGRFGLARSDDPKGAFTPVLAWNSGVTQPNVPLWLLDGDGPHILVEQDDTRKLFEIHPLTQDQTHWGDARNWSAPVALTGADGDDLHDIGNFGLVKVAATYYLVYNKYPTGVFYTRVSDSLLSGWSEPASFDSPVPEMDECLGLLLLDNGRLRFYFHQNFGPTHFAVDSLALPAKDSAGAWGATAVALRGLHRPPGRHLWLVCVQPNWRSDKLGQRIVYCLGLTTFCGVPAA